MVNTKRNLYRYLGFFLHLKPNCTLNCNKLLVPITGVTTDIVSELSSLNSFLRTNTAIKAKGLIYIAEGFNCDSVLNIPLTIS